MSETRFFKISPAFFEALAEILRIDARGHTSNAYVFGVEPVRGSHLLTTGADYVAFVGLRGRTLRVPGVPLCG
jgi:hypothetical protein